LSQRRTERRTDRPRYQKKKHPLQAIALLAVILAAGVAIFVAWDILQRDRDARERTAERTAQVEQQQRDRDAEAAAERKRQREADAERKAEAAAARKREAAKGWPKPTPRPPRKVATPTKQQPKPPEPAWTSDELGGLWKLIQDDDDPSAHRDSAPWSTAKGKRLRKLCRDAVADALTAYGAANSRDDEEAQRLAPIALRDWNTFREATGRDPITLDETKRQARARWAKVK